MNPHSRILLRAWFRIVVAVVARAARPAIPGALWIAFSAAFAASPSHAERWPNRILYFTRSAGYRHDVIAASQAVLWQLGETSRAFKITTTEDVSAFTTENLRHYAAVMFFTTGELPMSEAQKAALLASCGRDAASSASTPQPTPSTSGRNTESSSAATSTSIPGTRR